ncbi:MAG: preprotein translocase subunit SecA [Clostridia bacterium]|nr:preprotein translocase subunit SecA [Clostridia bacterium]
MGLLSALFGNYSKKEIKRIDPLVQKVLALEEQYKGMTDGQLKAQTPALKARLAAGETLDDILPDAFAVCREAADRVLGMRHFSVQIIGGIVLHQGRISEMKTGEGKTLVATLPAYLNALTGEGVHIVTVNDYLATRDSEWMGKVYTYLGLSVGLIVHGLTNDQRREAYAADITYGTNNEMGFDYLRDNMVVDLAQKVQRGHAFAIVDEVDSILIDEARTPLIISGQGEKSSELYTLADRFARTLKMTKVKEIDSKEDTDATYEGDYLVDEKAKTATLTPDGMRKAEQFFKVENISDPENNTLLHHINQAIRAHGIMHRDIDYMVKDGEVIIVDEFTGRLMLGRRYNEGLHQAIEAKEGVKVAHESKTLATITFQNYFRLYKKLSGMTGTAITEQEEFGDIYRLDVIEIPTNKPLAREDLPDSVYKTQQGKLNAIIRQIEECHAKGQPVLVGTVSIEKSEQLSSLLKKRGIPHNVLNAKHHEKEAQIVAQAGKLGAVTIATNMAGRGTDIMLGGNAEFLAKSDMRKAGYDEDEIENATSYFETDDQAILEQRRVYQELYQQHKEAIAPEAEQVRAAGGLYIIGTERHDSRRIDNQLRGRAGRQGDPGASRFYLSMEDDLMRLFGGERMYRIMETMGVDENQPIDSKLLSNSLETAQANVESRNFAARKSVLEFDDVMNVQREKIYSQRDMVLAGESLKPLITKMIHQTIEETCDLFMADERVADNWNLDGLRSHFMGWLTTAEDFNYSVEELNDIRKQDVTDLLMNRADEIYAAKEEEYGEQTMELLERKILLQNVDRHWMDHIDAMDELRNGIRLRAYAQHNPVVEYRNEGYDMFNAMSDAIREETARMMLTVKLVRQEDLERKQVATITSENVGGDGTVSKTVVKTKAQKVGRNDPCPCGSGKKYKKCCGAEE